MLENIMIAVITAIVSAISTILVTKEEAFKSTKLKQIDTEAERMGAYSKVNSALFERYEEQFDELRKELYNIKNENKQFRDDVIALTLENKELKEEVIKLTEENRKLTKLNQVLVDQLTALNLKLNNINA